MLEELARVVAERAAARARGVLHGAPAREGPRPRAQEDRRGGHRGGAGREGRERRASGRGVGRPAVPPAGGAARSAACRSSSVLDGAASGGRAERDEGARPSRSTSGSPRAGGSVPVFREMPGDLRTPVSAFLVARRARRARLPARERPRRRAARPLLVPRPRPRGAARGARRKGRRCSDAAGAREQTAGLLRRAARAARPAAGRDARAAALHRRRRRLPHLRRGAPLRADSRPPRRRRTGPWPPSPSTARSWPSTTCASAWC